MSDLIEPRLLKGFRDLLPSQMLARQHMLRTIESVLQTFGFQPLETPVLEYAEILHGKLGDEGEKLLYEFKDHGDREVAMRYDLTVPLARVVAQYADLPKPFKRYQVGPVWRADNTQRGRYREFYQFDLDIVGTDSPLADAEILVAMQEVMLALGVKSFKIRINDRRYLSDIAHQLQLTDKQQQEFYTGLDKWDKIGGPEGVSAYWQEHGLTQSQSNQLLDYFKNHDSLQHHPSQSTLNLALELGLQPDMASIDPTIVRGLDYYTGIVFETTLTDAPQYGSVFSGGRYDGLVSRFSKQQFPAVGSSVGVDRLLAALEELDLLPQEQTKTKVFVTIFSDQQVSNSLVAISKLRRHGIATEMAFEAGNLGKQLKTAAAKGTKYAIIIGPDEAAQGQVNLKDLSTGESEVYPLDQVIQKLIAE